MKKIDFYFVFCLFICFSIIVISIVMIVYLSNEAITVRKYDIILPAEQNTEFVYISKEVKSVYNTIEIKINSEDDSAINEICAIISPIENETLSTLYILPRNNMYEKISVQEGQGYRIGFCLREQKGVNVPLNVEIKGVCS